MHALLSLSLLKVILTQTDFFSLRTLSRIAPAANNFKPPCSQIKPTLWTKGTSEQFESQSKLIFQTEIASMGREPVSK